MGTSIRYGAQHSGQAESGTVQAVAHALWADYETDPEIVAAVLPRPLEPAAAEPRVHLNICNVEMDNGLSFGAGNFTVRARHGDVQGEYSLAMPMSAEAAVVGGREVFGEPKKLADIDVTREGDSVRGTVTRHGITYLELRGRVVETLETPPPRETLDFYFKFLITPDRRGFDYDPELIYCRRTYWIKKLERVEGEIILRESPVDPVADIRVGRVLSFNYLEYESEQHGEIVDRVPGEWLKPYVHQRYDAFSWRD